MKEKRIDMTPFFIVLGLWMLLIAFFTSAAFFISKMGSHGYSEVLDTFPIGFLDCFCLLFGFYCILKVLRKIKTS